MAYDVALFADKTLSQVALPKTMDVFAAWYLCPSTLWVQDTELRFLSVVTNTFTC